MQYLEGAIPRVLAANTLIIRRKPTLGGKKVFFSSVSKKK